MRYNRIGDSDLIVSELTLGSMTWGEQNSMAEAHSQLDYAFANGINMVDTAEMYPVMPRAETQGRTEAYIGEWLKRQKREDVIVATKVAGSRRNIRWLRNGPTAVDRANIEEALNDSLERLRTDYVDLYQIHWPARNTPIFGEAHFDPEKECDATPVEETLRAFADMVAKGKIRYVGLSNETPWGVMEFVRTAKAMNLPVVVSTQNAYSLLNRTFEMGLSEVCYREKVSLLAYSSGGFGTLSGKYLKEGATGRLNLFPGYGARYKKVNAAEAVREYAALAEKHGLRPMQMALAFARSRWFTGSVIIGATSMEQLKENMGAADVELSQEVLDGIEAIHARYPNPAP